MSRHLCPGPVPSSVALCGKIIDLVARHTYTTTPDLATCARCLKAQVQQGGELAVLSDAIRSAKDRPDVTLRAELALEVYRKVVEETESFEPGNLGLTLAYLMGAILEDDQVDISTDFYAEARAELHRIFPADHAVWRFVGAPC